MDPILIPVFGMLTGIVINIALFVTIILAVHYTTKARNKERMALIEKGADVSSIYKKQTHKDSFFKIGVVLIGVALGLVFAVIVSNLGWLPSVVAYFSMILLFGGIAMLVANEIMRKKNAT